jgi:hypothetical protein
MAGAQLLRLVAPAQVGIRKRRAHALPAVAENHMDRRGLELPRAVEHVREQRPPGERLEDLRQRRAHPLPQTCSQNDDG